MIRAHRDAVIAELQTRLPLAVFKSWSKGLDARGTDGKPLTRWAVVFTELSDKPRTRYTGGQWRDVYTVTVHSIGEDEDLAFWVQERVTPLTGKVLLVPGRKLQPVEFITGKPPDLDDDGLRPMQFTVTQFDITSDPA